MTERTITEQVIKHLRANLPGAVILKHSDRATSGIPDFSVSVRGQTYWIEMKYLRPKEKLHIKAHQLLMCRNLAFVTHGKCWVVIFESRPKQVTIWEPARIAGGFEPKFRLDGWPYDAILGLIA